MSDDPSASSSGSAEDGGPDAKKSRVEEPGNSQLGLQTIADVGSRSFNSSRDGPRKGTLTLNITDWEAFKRSTEKVYSESLQLAGIEWNAEAFVRNQSIGVWMRAIGSGQEPKWYRKVEFAVRWPHQPRHDYQRHNVVFFAGGPPAGWNELRTLDYISRTSVKNNALELKLDITTFHCYITEGAFGLHSRLHDVTFVFENRRMYSNKGFLAANADFFEGMFFGDFADKNKDEVELVGVTSKDFTTFLVAIALGASMIKPHQVFMLLRLADRFQAHKLTEACLDFLMKDKHANFSFVQQLEISDELNMSHFRDLLIESASVGELAEAAIAENEDKFTKETWVKLFLQYKLFKPV